LIVEQSNFEQFTPTRFFLLKNLKKTSAELIREKALDLLYSLLSTYTVAMEMGRKGVRTFLKQSLIKCITNHLAAPISPLRTHTQNLPINYQE
jgi:hypothetical protein